MAAFILIPLLYLGLQTAAVSSGPTCEIAKNATDATSNYNLTVHPTNYIANTSYTVTVTGTGNVMMTLLQAPAGTWENGTLNCSDSFVSVGFNATSLPLTAVWVSPSTILDSASAEIRAYIKMENETYRLSTNLTQSMTTATSTAVAMVSSSTAIKMTTPTSTSVTMKTTTPTTTVSASGSATSTSATNNFTSTTPMANSTTAANTTSGAGLQSTSCSFLFIMQLILLLFAATQYIL
ncbi:uncharacterized protein LOC102357207 [Latimeria chalumnae]|uniref:uncharacterized protein LOC102357207 n=1 Tax=Latimeria chalumnae TaxID=7897 RepID=UPI00313DD369